MENLDRPQSQGFRSFVCNRHAECHNRAETESCPYLPRRRRGLDSEVYQWSTPHVRFWSGIRVRKKD